MESPQAFDGIPEFPGLVPQRSNTDDPGVHVEFYRNPVDDEDHIKISTAADRFTKLDEVVTDRRKRQYPRAWEAYQNKSDQLTGQTRIEMVAWIDAGTVHVLKGRDIHTVEQLAAMSDNFMDGLQMLGLRKIREKAQKYLEAAAQTSEVDELRSEIAAMKAQLAEQVSMDPNPRGRPRKAA